MNIQLDWHRHSCLPEIELYTTTHRTFSSEMPVGLIPYFRWPGGVHISRWILDNPEVVKGRKVYDLGAGTGIIGIASALAGAEQVTSIDRVDTSEELCRKNFERNGVDVDFKLAEITNCKFDPSSVLIAVSFGHPRNLPLLEFMIKMAQQGHDVYICYTERLSPNWLPEFKHRIIERAQVPVEVTNLEHAPIVTNQIIQILC